MKKLIYSLGLFWLLSISIGLQAKKHPDRSEAQSINELSKFESFIRDVCDFLGSEALGYHALSEKNEKFIINIINELGMQDYNIEIRGMSNAAQQWFGRMNAFVIPYSRLNATFHSYMYISEEWFESLSEPEKDALVRHELMHLKHNHVLKRVTLGTLSSIAGIALLWSIASNMIKNIDPQTVTAEDGKSTIAKLYIYIASYSILNGLLLAKYSRMCEKEADIEAAKTMEDKKGFIDLFTNIKDHIEDPQSKFAFKRFIDATAKWLFTPLRVCARLFDTHPRLKDRIRYIQELKYS